MITIKKRELNGLAFNIYSNDDFFKKEFVVSFEWNKIIFGRPTLDTRKTIRRASKNGNGWSFILSTENDVLGKYFEYDKTEDNLIIEL